MCANEIIQLIENNTSTDLLRWWAVEDESCILYHPFFSKLENKVWTKSSLPRPRLIRQQLTNRKTLLVIVFTGDGKYSVRKIGEKWRILRSSPFK